MISSLRRRVQRWARAARAYLAGIGTSGSLLAGAALMFVLASALVAFRGWPHVAAQPSPGEVVVSPRPTSSLGSAVARRLTLITASASGGVAAPHGLGAAAGLARGLAGGSTGTPAIARRSIGTPASTSRPGAAPAGVSSGALTVTAACGLSGCGSSSAPASAPVPSAPTAVQPVIQKVGGTLGTVVSSIGNSASSAVQQATNTGSSAVQPASPPVGGAVSQVGSGTASTIGGVAKTISGVLSGLGH